MAADGLSAIQVRELRIGQKGSCYHEQKYMQSDGIAFQISDLYAAIMSNRIEKAVQYLN